MLYKQIIQNKRKTILLVAVFSILVVLIGWGISFLYGNNSYTGIIVSLIILAIYLPITYFSASSQVLNIAGAQKISQKDNPQLFDIVEELSIAARIPMPDVYIVQDPAPNAFATGIKPEKGAVAFTTGLIEQLNREELTGVAAHEIGHIRNYDIRLMTICLALVSVIIIISNIGTRMMIFGGPRNRGGNKKQNPLLMIVALLIVILAPLAAQFVQLAVSRNREYLADATAVDLTRNPVGLINALKKISGSDLDVERANAATAAMYINVPFKRKRNRRNRLLATHPSMENRIQRLQDM